MDVSNYSEEIQSSLRELFPEEFTNEPSSVSASYNVEDNSSVTPLASTPISDPISHQIHYVTNPLEDVTSPMEDFVNMAQSTAFPTSDSSRGILERVEAPLTFVPPVEAPPFTDYEMVVSSAESEAANTVTEENTSTEERPVTNEDVHVEEPEEAQEEEIVQEEEEDEEEEATTTSSADVPIQYSRFKGADWFNIVAQQRVMLAGLGGIGSWVSLFLSRLGLMELRLLDDDNFEAHNMSGQAVRVQDMSVSKVQTAYDIALTFSNYVTTPLKTKFTEEIHPFKVMICGFDNMEARKIFYNSWKEGINPNEAEEYLFIDGRLTAEMFQIFTITGTDVYAQSVYETQWLFNDYAADTTDCTFRQTSHLAGMIASYMVTYFTNFCSNLSPDNFPKRIPWFMEYNSILNSYDFEY